VGVVATLAPSWFYANVPWVDLAPPFSEHLMRLRRDEPRAGIGHCRRRHHNAPRHVRTSLAAYLLFAVPHLLFHVTHHDHYYTASQAAGETTALAITVLLPVALLALTWRVPSLDTGPLRAPTGQY
jgi:hypothetical protein